MDRAQALTQICSQLDPFDLVVIGGGATGLGVAVDGAARGHRVALIEQADFAKATSSRSTKLIHGGVRYLRQGNLRLVLEALRERGILQRNAPHLVHDLGFVIPAYRWWQVPFYGLGLQVYDRLAGRWSFGASQGLSRAATIERLPTIASQNLRGGILYHDGQFDDARLAVNLAQTATQLGAAVVNYVRCQGLLKQAGRVVGVRAQDQETGDCFEIAARAVINATGVFVDSVRQLDQPGLPAIVAPSQGIHFVLPSRFLPGNHALLVPQTEDGRVLFAIPWHGRVVVGTTDTPVQQVSLEPRVLPAEMEFMFKHIAQYLTEVPTPDDLLSVYAGLRPLVRASGQRTAALSRDYRILISPSGLVTITGGKWTTYRRMAEAVVNRAEQVAGLRPQPCITQTLQIHGWTHEPIPEAQWRDYGADARAIRSLVHQYPELGQPIHPQLEHQRAEVIWQVRQEMARQVEDVLARRTRALFLNAKASMEAAPVVAQLMAQELGQGSDWIEAQLRAYRALAAGYLYSG